MEPSQIAPLDRGFLKRIDAEASWLERVAPYVPVLGWIVHSHLWTKRVGPIRQRLINQLVSRPRSARRAWEGEARYRTIAQTVCEIAQTEMGWPNDAFIPADPFAVVFWSYDDGLDMEVAIMAIEDQLDLKIPDADVVDFSDKSLGEFVSYLAQAEANLNKTATVAR